jgi:large subunit ribosomal protein MRP49
MVSVAARMRKLQAAITAIRLGPGAAKLPQDVRKIELRFAYKMNGGHMGARWVYHSTIGEDGVPSSDGRLTS